MPTQPVAQGARGAHTVLRGDPAHPTMCIADGHGGVLFLDTSDADLRWLAQGLRLLLGHDLSGGTGAIKVTTGPATYWLSRVAGAQHEYRIASLYDLTQVVQLPGDLIMLVAELIERLGSV